MCVCDCVNSLCAQPFKSFSHCSPTHARIYQRMIHVLAPPTLPPPLSHCVCVRGLQGVYRIPLMTGSPPAPAVTEEEQREEDGGGVGCSGGVVQ